MSVPKYTSSGTELGPNDPLLMAWYVRYHDYAALEAEHAKLKTLAQAGLETYSLAKHWEDRARSAEMELIAARMTAELLRKDREQDARGSNALEDEVARLQKRLAAAEKVCQVADDCAENGYHMESHLLLFLKAWKEAT